VRGDQTPLTSMQRRKSIKEKKTTATTNEKPRLYDELQQYDSHRKEKSKQKQKLITNPKREEPYTCHEYKELR
jgi:hypothetical protein